ncbi:MAG: hypothetical protein ABSH34_03330 [Verrucomicrobiota bacterium]|jgi:hypothetical protein
MNETPTSPAPQATLAAPPLAANSTSQQVRRRQFRAAPFVLALLCFLLPFITISCQGVKAVSLTGLQLAAGTTIEQRDPITGQAHREKIPSETSVLLVLLCTAAAAGLCFASGRSGALLPAVAGAAGFLLMLVAKSHFDSQTLEQGRGVLAVGYEMGFILTCLLLLAGAGLCGFQYKQEQPQTRGPAQSQTLNA